MRPPPHSAPREEPPASAAGVLQAGAQTSPADAPWALLPLQWLSSRVDIFRRGASRQVSCEIAQACFTAGRAQTTPPTPDPHTSTLWLRGAPS